MITQEFTLTKGKKATLTYPSLKEGLTIEDIVSIHKQVYETLTKELDNTIEEIKKS